MKCFNHNYKKFVAGISGGPDSMCLLDLYAKNIAVVCHVNYQKRPTAFRDQKIVETYCQKKNIPFEVLLVNEDQFKNKKNFQAQARKIRYDFYFQIAKKYNLKKVYVGHNFNDFLETAFMQKKRSNKLLFYGIKAQNFYNQLLVVRPLLLLQRTWIETYCQKNKINFGIDESNSELIYERNRVRNEISKWTKDQIYKFKQLIISYNKKKSKLLSTVEKKYLVFQNQNFDLNWLWNQSELEQYHLIYYFLINHNFHSSDAKIIAILKFLKLKSNKAYRIESNIFIKNFNSYLKLIKE